MGTHFTGRQAEARSGLVSLLPDSLLQLELSFFLLLAPWFAP